MVDKRGFLLIEVLMGLVLFGIIIVTCLPILNNALGNLRMVKDKIDMIFLVESVIEQIKSFQYSLTDDEEYLFDINLKDLINLLKKDDLVTVTLPLETNNNYFYTCTIYKEDIGTDLWKLWVEISTSEEKVNISKVKVVFIMPIPQDNFEKQ